MMTKTDYEIVGIALSSLPISMRVAVYRRLVKVLSERNPEFDAQKFGKCMNIPRLMRNP